MTLYYDATNWYWSVQDASPGTQVWSSASGSYVALADATYVAWLASGGVTTVIDTEVNRQGVIAAAALDRYLLGYGRGYQSLSPSTTQTLAPPLLDIYDCGPLVAGVEITLPQSNKPNSRPLGAPTIFRNFGLEYYELKTSTGASLGIVPPGMLVSVFTYSFQLPASGTQNSTGIGAYASFIMPFLIKDIPVWSTFGGFIPLQLPTDSLLGRDTAGAGQPENILLNATLSMDGSGNLQRAALTGDVTASAGSNATTIASGAVTLAKQANMATASVVYRKTAGSGAPEVNTLATLKTDLVLVKGDVGLGNVDNTSDATKNAASVTLTNKTIDGSQLVASSVPGTKLSLGQLSNYLGANVALNNTANYFDGPSIAQGTAGTWFVIGTVNVTDTTASAAFRLKLWDGTTVISAGSIQTVGASQNNTVTLSGFITSPAGNLRVSARDLTSTSGFMVSDGSVNGNKDCGIVAFRIN